MGTASDSSVATSPSSRFTAQPAGGGLLSTSISVWSVLPKPWGRRRVRGVAAWGWRVAQCAAIL